MRRPRAMAISGLAGPLLLALCVMGGCGADGSGRQGSAQPPSAASSTAASLARATALRLTHRDPPGYRAACAALHARVGADFCPHLVPAGALHVNIASALRGYPRTFELDLTSPALATSRGRRIPAAGGHWTITATASAAGHKLFRFYLHPNSADRPTACRTVLLVGQRVTICRVPAHEHGGGYYAGHVAAEWDTGGTSAVQITAHGYPNRDRLLAMMASVIRAHHR